MNTIVAMAITTLNAFEALGGTNSIAEAKKNMTDDEIRTNRAT
jgi:hypothetical protein